MSDRTLLEAAARAAGLKPSGLWRGGMMEIEGPDATEFLGDHRYWNPLVNDGDALRLAVKLNLWIGVDANATYVATDDFEVAPTSESESHGDDPLAATRLAIVRAAAAIGNKLEKSE